MKEVEKMNNLTKEQKEELNKIFSKEADNILKVIGLIKTTKESLINIHGEFNVNIQPHHVEMTLLLSEEILEPMYNKFIEFYD